MNNSAIKSIKKCIINEINSMRDVIDKVKSINSVAGNQQRASLFDYHSHRDRIVLLLLFHSISIVQIISF